MSNNSVCTRCGLNIETARVINPDGSMGGVVLNHECKKENVAPHFTIEVAKLQKGNNDQTRN